MANSSDNKKVPSGTPSKGNKGNLAAGLLPARVPPSKTPLPRLVRESDAPGDHLTVASFGKRRHKRGWCSL